MSFFKVTMFGFFTAALMGTLPLAHAETFDQSSYYTITQVQTQEVPVADSATAAQPLYDVASPATSQNLYDGSLVSLSDIVNLGKELWTLIEKNKPVVNVSLDHANALPRGVSDWTSLGGWQAPRARAFRTTFKNAYGMTVVDFTYRLTYTAGGSVDGRGRYLSSVAVVPQDLYVAWGYTFNAQVTVPNITNAGTQRNPVAAVELLVKWDVDTVLNHAEQSAGYYVRGDGEFEAL